MKQVPKGYWRNGLGKGCVKTCWGPIRVKVQRLKAKTGKRKQIYWEAVFDESGWSPEALKRLLELSSRLPYEESSYLAQLFGLGISGSSLETMTSPYAQSCKRAVRTRLAAGFASEPPKPVSAAISGTQESAIQKTAAQGRVMVLQLDGVQVLGRPEAGVCPGMEIKSAVLYPQNSPGDRRMLADRCTAEDFLPLLPGLLEAAKLSSKDALIGLGDGASWIDNLFNALQAKRITDVYHACEYLDTVMVTLGWDEKTRTAHRCDWYRGEVNARDWLQQHIPSAELCSNWDKDTQTALNYLNQRLDSMDYALFAKEGLPIGSGQVEAMNKSVIGTRMKRSGMHWSQTGAAAMASLRAQTCAKHSLIDFDNVRFDAFALAA